MMRLFFLAALSFLASSALAKADGAAATRVCLSGRETTETVAARQLLDPMTIIRNVQAANRAETVSSRLCRWDEDYVYELTLLRRDGKVLRLFISASDGKSLPPRQAKESGR